MEKQAIIEKNWNFFHVDMAGFINKLNLFSLLIREIDKPSPVEVSFSKKENPVLLKIFYQQMEEEQKEIFLKKINVSVPDLTKLIMKMWQSLRGEFDEKCKFEFNGIVYDFEIKGYQPTSIFDFDQKLLFIPIKDLLFLNNKVIGEESLEIVAELRISLAEPE